MVKKKLYLPALVLALVIALTVFVGAYDFNYVIDDAELLTADEKADVEAYYDRIYTEDNLLLVFVTAYGKGDVLSALPDYADGAADMLLLYVDMDARHFDLYQYNSVSGESAFRINSSETDTILDAVLTMPQTETGTVRRSASRMRGFPHSPMTQTLFPARITTVTRAIRNMRSRTAP